MSADVSESLRFNEICSILLTVFVHNFVEAFILGCTFPDIIVVVDIFSKYRITFRSYEYFAVSINFQIFLTTVMLLSKLISQREEKDAFKSLGTGNRIATFLFYVSKYMVIVFSRGNNLMNHE